MHEVRDQGGEAVVVAEADLGGGDGVVLVDDRQHPELEQLRERLVGVAVVRPPGHVVERQQHLPGHETVAGELLGVAVHQQPLPHRGGRLLRGEATGAPGQPERGEAGGDGAGGDQHDLHATLAGRGEHVDERAHTVGVDPAGGGGERGGADLDDDASCLGHLPAQGHPRPSGSSSAQSRA